MRSFRLSGLIASLSLATSTVLSVIGHLGYLALTLIGIDPRAAMQRMASAFAPAPMLVASPVGPALSHRMRHEAGMPRRAADRKN